MLHSLNSHIICQLHPNKTKTINKKHDFFEGQHICSAWLKGRKYVEKEKKRKRLDKVQIGAIR